MSLRLRVAEFLAGKFSASSEFLLDAENLVVLGQSLGTAWCTGLDLASRQAYNQVSNECVLGFSGTMRDHGAPTGALGQLVGVD